MMSMNERNQRLVEEFRANGGKVGGSWEGRPLVLVTTTGAKSGKEYTIPLMYLGEGDRVYIFASKGGAPSNPDWYYNLLAHPKVTVELGDQTYTASAKPITGPERDAIYGRWSEMYPMFREYQEKTSRTIPVIELVRRPA